MEAIFRLQSNRRLMQRRDEQGREGNAGPGPSFIPSLNMIMRFILLEKGIFLET
jgi:hypothetical protein